MNKILLNIMLIGFSPIIHSFSAEPNMPTEIKRVYKEAERLRYRIQMSHLMDDKLTSSYDSTVEGVVMKGQDVAYFEEFQWTSIRNDSKKQLFSDFDKNFKQILSLEAPFKLEIPKDLTKLSPFFIGPVTDFLTFYVDESLLIRNSKSLRNKGDHIFLNVGIASSWGVGQDCIDFDIKIIDVDNINQIVKIEVSHLPPSKMCITPPVPWMEEQVSDTPNNWYNTERTSSGWMASIGKEIFVVEARIDLKTGKLLSAEMDNPVIFKSRNCSDAQFKNCTQAGDHKILRTLKLELLKN